MKKRAIKLLALVLSLVMLLAACGTPDTPSTPETTDPAPDGTQPQVSATEEVSKWPEYLNMESSAPIIKDEYKDSVEPLRLMLVTSAQTDWDALWIGKYLEEKFNLKFEVELIPKTSLEERRSLTLNSGDLPDLMINMELSSVDFVTYGQEEGMFLQLDQYISEELTPNIVKYLDDETKKTITLTDGHIYGLPLMRNQIDQDNSYNRYFIDVVALKEAGIDKVPTTLDEFTAAMYALKENGVDYPFGGGMTVNGISSFMLNAFGYIVNGGGAAFGLNPSMRNGEVVIPAYDTEVYKEYLALMNQYYEDGLMVPNYFSVEGSEVNALMVEGEMATFGHAPHVAGIENWADFDSLIPLTSDWQPNATANRGVPISMGGFAVSADTEYPELCMRIADLFFDPVESYITQYAAVTDEAYTFDGKWILAELNEAKNNVVYPEDKLPEGVTASMYRSDYIMGSAWWFGTNQTREASVEAVKLMGGDMPLDIRETWTYDNADGTYKSNINKNVHDNPDVGVAYVFPDIYYVSAEISDEIAELKAVIEPYAKEQIARFITGDRDLSEIDAFKDELTKLGADRLLEIYQTIYANMQ